MIKLHQGYKNVTKMLQKQLFTLKTGDIDFIFILFHRFYFLQKE